MTLFSTSTVSDGCAAATPLRASVTTLSAELMSFFMTSLRSLAAVTGLRRPEPSGARLVSAASLRTLAIPTYARPPAPRRSTSPITYAGSCTHDTVPPNASCMKKAPM